jgi:hypothetical protein
MLITSIQIKDVEELELLHAILTKDGWVIPAWLVYLREEVTKRDQILVDQIGV